MIPLADEPLTNYLHRRKPADREYLYFALVLIALLLVSGVQLGLSPQPEANTVSSR